VIERLRRLFSVIKGCEGYSVVDVYLFVVVRVYCCMCAYLSRVYRISISSRFFHSRKIDIHHHDSHISLKPILS
jgi:hypothetical protein